MSDKQVNTTELADVMWRIVDSMRGVSAPSKINETAPFLAYVALLVKGADEGVSIDAVFEDSHVSPSVKDYLLSTWNEGWDESIGLLAKHVGVDSLREFVLHYDFASDGGKVSGEHGTPSCINKLALAILNVKPDDRVADFGCGYGNFLVELADQQPCAQLYGVDVDPAAVCLAQIRMDLLGNKARIVRDDMFSGEIDGTFEKVFSNYPFGMRLTSFGRGGKYYDDYRSGETGFGRPLSADWMFNKAICDSLAQDGTAVAIMTNGAAFNGGDRQARKYFLDNKMIKAVVALPGNLFRYTAIPTTLIVFGYNDGPVRLVDATDLNVPGRRLDTIGDDEISAILDRLSNDGDYSRLVGKDEFAMTDYNLVPTRYLGRSIELENASCIGDLALSVERGASITARALDMLTVDEDTGICFLRLSDISDGCIGDDLPRLRELDPKTEKQWLRTGDLIVSKNGAPFKIAVAEVPDGKTILANGNLYIIRLDAERIDPYFVAAFLASDDGKELMERMVVGTTIPNLPLRNLKDIQVPVPDKGVQETVARQYRARLDEIEVLKIKLDKARIGAAAAYDEVVRR